MKHTRIASMVLLTIALLASSGLAQAREREPGDDRGGHHELELNDNRGVDPGQVQIVDDHGVDPAQVQMVDDHGADF